MAKGKQCRRTDCEQPAGADGALCRSCRDRIWRARKQAAERRELRVRPDDGDLNKQEVKLRTLAPWDDDPFWQKDRAVTDEEDDERLAELQRRKEYVLMTRLRDPSVYDRWHADDRSQLARAEQNTLTLMPGRKGP